MSRYLYCLLVSLLLLESLVSVTAYARRGNPATNSSARLQYYIIDSDDDHPRRPQTKWVDTSYNRSEWTRVTGFTDSDDGAATMAPTTTLTFPIPAHTYSVPRGAVSTNGTIALMPNGQSPTLTNDAYVWSDPINRLHPINNSIDTFAVIAALWGDWELRTTGDSSKVFYRATTDTAYISYYDLALKGTEGRVRATFQVVFTRDSSITIQYRSFDGSFAGRTAEEIIQRHVNIGLSGSLTVGTNYLHRGHYYATSTGSSAYALDLHDGLAVRFIRVRDNMVSARSITYPTTYRQEFAQNNYTYEGSISNWTDADRWDSIRFELRNLSENKIVTTKTDTAFAYGGFNGSYFGPTYQGLPCGEYEVTMKVFTRKEEDPWTHDNILRKQFYVLSSQSFPFYEQFNDGLSGCVWANVGAEIKPAKDVMFDPVSPRTGDDGALVLDRTALNGRLYTDPIAGDTITSAPINIAGKSNVYLNFSYQRGLKSDPRDAGTQLQTRIGPDLAFADGSTVLEQPDTLVVEGLLASGAKWNPAASSWQVLHTIVGGIDLKTRKVKIELPSSMISDHFRMRFRLKARENDLALTYPHDDNDAFVIDGIQLISPPGGKTELEIAHVDLGAHHYTRVPRDIRFLRPKVTINNNGRNAGLASYAVRMIIWDQLNREVYHKSQSFAMPSSFSDTTISMQDWDIKGSQGGTFTIKTFLSENFAEMYRANDTNTTTRTLFIADSYGLDDGEPDTAGTLERAPLEWYYDFLPLKDDTVRGVDLFFLEQQGATSWQIEFKRGSILLGQRSFSVTPSGRGFARGTFTPLHLPSVETLTVHITQTVGQPIGGDASKGLIFRTNTAPTFSVLHPEVVNEFRLPPGDVPFYGGDATAINGGVLIPMFRLVFSGSAQYLPVELIRFAGKRVERNVELIWKTASEENSLGFTLEREATTGWDLVASVPSRNAKLGAEYFAEDILAPTSALTYRLTERDLDGSTRVIGHVRINSIDDKSVSVRVYPNPVTDVLRFELSGAMPVGVTLHDALGREVKRAFGATELDVSDLASGVYYLHVQANGETHVRQVTISR